VSKFVGKFDAKMWRLKRTLREQVPDCYYDDVENGTANHGQGVGNSKRGPIFDRQTIAAKFLNRIDLGGI
jgi:hypothetical protein